MNRAYRDLKKAIKNMSDGIAMLEAKLKETKRLYRLELRKEKHKADVARDRKTFSLLTHNPSALFSSIRNSKTSSVGTIPFLTVGNRKYTDSNVAEGFFESILELKSLDIASLQSSPNYHSWSRDYEFILEICKNKKDIPLISLEKSSKILNKMCERFLVNDPSTFYLCW